MKHILAFHYKANENMIGHCHVIQWILNNKGTSEFIWQKYAYLAANMGVDYLSEKDFNLFKQS